MDSWEQNHGWFANIYTTKPPFTTSTAATKKCPNHCCYSCTSIAYTSPLPTLGQLLRLALYLW